MQARPKTAATGTVNPLSLSLFVPRHMSVNLTLSPEPRAGTLDSVSLPSQSSGKCVVFRGRGKHKNRQFLYHLTSAGKELELGLGPEGQSGAGHSNKQGSAFRRREPALTMSRRQKGCGAIDKSGMSGPHLKAGVGDRWPLVHPGIMCHRAR